VAGRVRAGSPASNLPLTVRDRERLRHQVASCSVAGPTRNWKQMALLLRTYCFITSTILVMRTGANCSELLASVVSISERPANALSASTIG